LESQLFQRVCSADALAPGQMAAFLVSGREVVVVRTREGELYALDNTCTHAYARLCEGRLRGYRLMCPLHGASFDVRTGAVVGLPANAPIAAHAVRVVDGQIEVALSG
jgi:3-phenylpropionate/trans-cinnamate dioxygenase ferredoxin component